MTKTMVRALTLSIALLIGSAADAQQKQVPLFDGMRLTPAATCPFSIGQRGVWVNVSDGLMYYRRANGADDGPIGTGGGGSTGNYTFSANTMDLTGAANMSIAPTTATSISIGKANVATTLAGGVVVENTTGFGSPMIRGSAANGYMSLTSDGVGSTWGGTGITAEQQAIAANSNVNITVNDVPVMTFYPGRVSTGLQYASAAPTLSITSNTIAPTVPTSFVGAGLIKTITAPYAGSFWIYVVPTAAFTWDTSGNIAVAGTATVGELLGFWHDAGTSLYYPSYIGGGGASTGNYSFSANAMDLSGAAAMSIAPTTATSIVLGKSTSMTGAATFATGTGAVTLNGDTTISGSKTFTTGTGQTTISGLVRFTEGAKSAIVNQSTTGAGGSLTLQSGAALTTSAAAGGSLFLNSGAGDGVGANGTVEISTANGGGAGSNINLTPSLAVTVSSSGADGSTARALTVNTTASWVNAAAMLISASINSVRHFAVYASGLIESSWARAIGTAQTVGASFENTSPALVGAQQYSPMLTLLGRTWETTGGTSQTSGWGFQARGVNATTATSYLDLFHNANGSLTRRLAIFPAVGGGVKMFPDPDTGTGFMEMRGSDFRIGATSTNWIEFNYNVGGSFVITNNNVLTHEFAATAMMPRSAYLITAGASSRPYSEMYTRHPEFVQAAKPTCAVGAGAGTGSPSCAITTNSTDAKGVVTVTLGTTPTAGATLVTVTFNTAFSGSSWRCNITPANADASDNPTKMPFVGTTTSTTMPLTTPTVAYTTGAPAFAWDCAGSTSN